MTTSTKIRFAMSVVTGVMVTCPFIAAVREGTVTGLFIASINTIAWMSFLALWFLATEE